MTKLWSEMSIRFFIAITVLLMTMFTKCIKCNCAERFRDEFHAAQIILFIAPVVNLRIAGQLVVYWLHPNFLQGLDSIEIYNTHTNRSILKITPESNRGIKYTGIGVSNLQSDNKYRDQCLGFSASWVRYGVKKKSSCLSTHPNWMSKDKSSLQSQILSSLFIPGTHDSGAYFTEMSQSVVNRYSVTQKYSVLDQLIAGARYLDLRPCKGLYVYWICHGIVFMNPLSIVLNEIKQFIDNTDEIVILGFKEFPIGFSNDEDHHRFIEYLETELHGYYSRQNLISDWAVKLNTMWKTDKRLILSYDHEVHKTTDILWSPILHQWIPTSNVDELKSFLQNAESQDFKYDYPFNMRVAMAQNTLTSWNVVQHAVADAFKYDRQSLKKLAAKAGPNITVWYNEEFYSSASIVAVDFIEYTGIVEVAIEWNKRRCDKCYEYYKQILDGAL